MSGLVGCWRSAPSAERRARRREKEAKRREKERGRVVEQLRAADITERREGGGRGLLREPILIFRGSLRPELRVFDQDGEMVGVARYRDGGRLVELHDADGAWLLGIERPVWLVFFYLTFVLKGADGEEIARIGPPRWKPTHTVRSITSREGSLGSLRLGLRLFSKHSTVEDATGNEVAQIHSSGKGAYVVEMAPSVAEPLRSAAVAASIVWDLARHDWERLMESS